MISYIVDEDGNKTHAIVPIDEWENINEDSFFFKNQHASYPKKHILNIVLFLKSIHHFDIQEWKKKYEEYFSYYNKLDYIDFMVLYLYRSGFFGRYFSDEMDPSINMNESDLFQEHLELSHIKYRSINDEPLDWETYKKTREKISTTNEQEFLIYFHATLRFTDESIIYFKKDYKRVHKSAERDRLFIYDICELMSHNLADIPEEVMFQEIENSPEQYIAGHLYNNNVSQVYRARKEAFERIVTFDI